MRARSEWLIRQTCMFREGNHTFVTTLRGATQCTEIIITIMTNHLVEVRKHGRSSHSLSLSPGCFWKWCVLCGVCFVFPLLVLQTSSPCPKMACIFRMHIHECRKGPKWWDVQHATKRIVLRRGARCLCIFIYLRYDTKTWGNRAQCVRVCACVSQFLYCEWCKDNHPSCCPERWCPREQQHTFSCCALFFLFCSLCPVFIGSVLVWLPSACERRVKGTEWEIKEQ